MLKLNEEHVQMIEHKYHISHTVSMEILLSQLMIGTFEERATETFDVPSAYLNADMPEDKCVLLKLEDEFL